MSGTRKSEWVLPVAAGVTLVGAVASAPLVALAAAALAAVASARSRGLSTGSEAFAGSGFDAVSLGAELAKPLMVRGFGGRDALSPASPSGKDDDSDGSGSDGENGRDPERGSRSYHEFAAGLEGDDQEISFLPPYASDTADGAVGEATAGDTDPKDESPLVADLQDVETDPGKMPVPRRFALGTVAIIRRLLEPPDVERILIEQRRYPRLRFGDVAVQLDLLSEAEVQELLVAQEQGIFSDEEISDARRRLTTYHTDG
ncbi:MAG: hypothetical protein MJB57_16725 [Gemmatimonadetes bacterium]|nr:hypothetical protein [Gemmatimonadota bacterium]